MTPARAALLRLRDDIQANKDDPDNPNHPGCSWCEGYTDAMQDALALVTAELAALPPEEAAPDA